MKNLTQKLNTLKKVKPNSEWKKENREFLLSQIGVDSDSVHVDDQNFSINIFTKFQIIFRQLSQPVGVVLVLMSVMIGGGIFGVVASNNSKPGDSLYIAKIVSEKTQLALTFNNEEKIKLALSFAQNRTREIAQVIEESGLQENSEEEKQEQVDSVNKLTQDFKNEIKRIKQTRIKTIARKKQVVEVKNNNDDVVSKEDEDSMKIFSANLGKSDKGMDFYESPNFDQVIDQAQVLIDNKDYAGTLEKLEQANVIIEEDKINKDDENESTEEIDTEIKDENENNDEEKAENTEDFEAENEYDIMVDNSDVVESVASNTEEILAKDELNKVASTSTDTIEVEEEVVVDKVDEEPVKAEESATSTIKLLNL